MKVFKAEPIESKLSDDRWKASTHKGVVIVRAKTESKAMTLLEWEFKAVETRPIDVEDPPSPWGDKSLVEWTEINDPKYPAEGKAGKGKGGVRLPLSFRWQITFLNH